jgi:hypothetical protein
MRINVAAVLVASAAVAGQGANAKVFGKDASASTFHLSHDLISACSTTDIHTRRSTTADPSTWSVEQAKAWLSEHKIHVPTGPNDILNAVRDNFDTVARKGARAAGAAQAYYETYSDKAVDGWTESQLREYLLEQGVVSPKGTVEELRIAAKQK